MQLAKSRPKIKTITISKKILIFTSQNTKLTVTSSVFKKVKIINKTKNKTKKNNLNSLIIYGIYYCF